jgi:hypothetical protein
MARSTRKELLKIIMNIPKGDWPVRSYKGCIGPNVNKEYSAFAT